MAAEEPHNETDGAEMRARASVDMQISTNPPSASVTTQKFMHTLRWHLRIEVIFSSHVNTDNGGECSRRPSAALIRENWSPPRTGNRLLSDSRSWIY